MDFNEVKSFLESSKDNADVQEYLKGLAKPTLDSVKELVQNDKDFVSWLDSEKDIHHNKALEKFKSKELKRLVDEELSKRNPSETAEQKKIRELEERLNEKERETTRKELTNLALKTAQEKKLPIELIDYFIGEDETVTLSNLQKFEQAYNQAVEKILQEKGLGDKYIPPKNNSSSSTKASSNDVFNLINQTKHRK